MQLLVKGTRRIIFILCAVSDAKRYYSSPRACLKNKNCTKRMFYFPFS